jgi:hypothetical protein
MQERPATFLPLKIVAAATVIILFTTFSIVYKLLDTIGCFTKLLMSLMVRSRGHFMND